MTDYLTDVSTVLKLFEKDPDKEGMEYAELYDTHIALINKAHQVCRLYGWNYRIETEDPGHTNNFDVVLIDDLTDGEIAQLVKWGFTVEVHTYQNYYVAHMSCYPQRAEKFLKNGGDN